MVPGKIWGKVIKKPYESHKEGHKNSDGIIKPYMQTINSSQRRHQGFSGSVGGCTLPEERIRRSHKETLKTTNKGQWNPIKRG
jgi:hypothetical protein